MTKLLDLLDSKDVDVQFQATKVIANLTAEERNHKTIMKEYGHEVLIEVLSRNHPEDIHRIAVGAITNLAVTYNCQTQIIELDIIEVLSNVAEKARDVKTVEMVAKAIANLCGNNNLQKERKGIQALLEIADTWPQPKVFEEVARGVANFARETSKKLLIICPIFPLYLIHHSSHLTGQSKFQSPLLASKHLKWILENIENKNSAISLQLETALCYLAHLQNGKFLHTFNSASITIVRNEVIVTQFFSLAGEKIKQKVVIIAKKSSNEDIRIFAEITLNKIDHIGINDHTDTSWKPCRVTLRGDFRIDSDPLDFTFSHDFTSFSVTSASYSRCLFPNSSVEEINKFRISMNLVKRNEDKGEETIGDLKLSLDTQLGSKSSKVFLGRFKNRDVAAKRSLIIKKGNLEIDRLSSYDSHPNIVTSFGFVSDKQYNYICFELCKCSLDMLISFCSSKQTGGRKSAADPDLINLMQGKQLWDANSNPSETLINLMKNIAYALDFLHTLKVVHTAINPENILVTDSLTAKLSRLGDIILISEELVSSTFLSSSSNLGWRPVDKSVTYALDMFSFGCILFYSLSGGLHPFGDEKNCVKHIASNQPSLSEINHLPEAKQLVRGLLNSNPESRPSASEVLKHPIFWSTDKKIQLIVEASDHFTAVPAFLQNLTATERKITTALAKKWVSQVDGNVLNSMRSKYRDNDFGELVRFFRNCKCHYSDIMIDIKGSIVSIQTVMGDMPDGFHSYFASRFPELLMVVHNIISNNLRSESKFNMFFKKTS
ncbi:serine/threonine-protein kinase/endoribonuclease IRE1a-like isoform X1 [Brassica napus]|uniref:serine/threonine-protein kinase/endoribonuclease IRE1a-like isoform X1 n=1 Tax=Brassica napus TaxID=3708 RepID=UPI0020795F5C|nr:serine/threonine-protein kinase/endoribonuclease IRE1a-like isoform X1 [Brassica napus]